MNDFSGGLALDRQVELAGRNVRTYEACYKRIGVLSTIQDNGVEVSMGRTFDMAFALTI